MRKGLPEMSAQEEYKRNQKYYLAVQYLLKLLNSGAINHNQLRRANRYFAEKFDVTMRIFV